MVWVNIPDTDVDQDSPVTVALMTALRDNVRGALQLNDGAPVPYSGWHPYNMLEIGDGNDGVYWDRDVDGNTGVIDSPALENGFEYAVRMLNFAGNNTQIRTTLVSVNVTNPTPTTLVSYSQGSANGYIYYPLLRAPEQRQTYSAHCLFNSNSNDPGFIGLGNYVLTDVITNIRVRLGSSGVATGGRLALYRRAIPRIT